MYDCFYIFVMSFSLVYGFVRDPLAVLIVLSVQALIKSRYRCSPETCKWEELATRASSGRGLFQEYQVGGAYAASLDFIVV